MSEPVSLARPPALKTGNRVAVLCVSSPVGPAELGIGLDTLRFAGLDPVIYPSRMTAAAMRPYLAGDDTLRAGDLRAALTDRSIAGILFARGGYGAQRTLEAMDWDGLAGIPPKVLAGYSDVTAVLRRRSRCGSAGPACSARWSPPLGARRTTRSGHCSAR